QGGKVADVWVTSARPVQTPTLLSHAKAAHDRALEQAVLPSRAADNLFWLGRYVERSEHNMRLFRAYFARISDGAAHDDPVPTFIRKRLMEDVGPDAQDIADRFAAPLTLGLQAASRIGDRFSPDGMMALRGLVQDCLALENRRIPLDDIPSEISNVLRQITGFAGLMHENMVRSDGWRFLSLGVSLERAANLSLLLAACLHPKAPDGALDLALEIGDSVVAHRSRFLIWANAGSVADLLGLDPQNPRSIRYHVSRAKDHIAHLPKQETGHILTEVSRQVLTMETKLATANPSDVTPDFVAPMQQDIWRISDALHEIHLA
ncbi:MAG: alpha-E domain-containing protein, partial [Pseudomonadota bacterium]